MAVLESTNHITRADSQTLTTWNFSVSKHVPILTNSDNREYTVLVFVPWHLFNVHANFHLQGVIEKDEKGCCPICNFDFYLKFNEQPRLLLKFVRCVTYYRPIPTTGMSGTGRAICDPVCKWLHGWPPRYTQLLWRSVCEQFTLPCPVRSVCATLHML